MIRSVHTFRAALSGRKLVRLGQPDQMLETSLGDGKEISGLDHVERTMRAAQSLSCQQILIS